MTVIGVQKKRGPDLRTALQKGAKRILKEKGETRFANAKMWRKIAIIFTAWVYVYTLPYFVGLDMWLFVPHGIFTGFVVAAVGMNIMHDAVHGALSKRKWINSSIGTIALFLGCVGAWDMQHNVLHHSYTNIDGHDEDIATPVLRLSPFQKHYWIFKYQHIYAWGFYAIMTLWWATFKDGIQLHRYHKMKIFRQRTDKLKNWVHLILVKIMYFTMWLVLPMYFWEMTTGQVILFFLIKHAVCGLTLGVIFQLAHAVPKAEMFPENTKGSQNTAEHQLATSVNFAMNSKFWTWLSGGLNRQAPHHLFTRICSIHLEDLDQMIEEEINKVNKEGVEKIELKSYATFREALSGHYQFLKEMGKKPIATI